MRKAVIVDDDPITRMDLADILAEAGFVVAGQGGDGFDAVELCRTHAPDLVLMDIKMPVFDGLDATKAIVRENLAGCVVILTAFNNPEFIARAKEFGVSGYVVKPVDERTLLPAVEIALAQSSRYRRVVDEKEDIRKKLEDKAVIDRAKALLARKDGIGESEAYAAMRTAAMNKSVAIIEVARRLVDTLGDRAEVEKTKNLLMQRKGLSESVAFRRIKKRAEQRGISMRQAAADIRAEFEP